MKISFLFLLVLFIAGVLSSHRWLVSFSVIVATVLGLGQLWKRYSLQGVGYRRKWRYRRGFPGEELDLRLEVENKKLLPLSWLKVSDRWPKAVAPVEEGRAQPSAFSDHRSLVNLFSLWPYQRIMRSFRIGLSERGIYPLGPVSLESGDLFGFFRQVKEAPFEEYLTVYPEILPLEKLHLPADDPFGDRRSRRGLFEDQNRPIGIRPYQPEDQLRHVHWPATARSGALQVKIYQPVTSHTLVICLNVTTTEKPWLGSAKDLIEQLVKVSASLAYHSSLEGYAVGLVSNGCLAHADQPFSIAPGRSPAQLANLLEALAAVTPYVTASFETYLVKTMPKIPYGATLLVVTGLVTDALCETLLRLKRYRSHISLLSLGSDPPPELAGIRTFHLRFSTPEAVVK